MRAIVILFLIVVVVVGLVWLWPRLEGDAPVLSGPEQVRLGTAPREIEITWEDTGMGLAEVEAVLRWPETGEQPAREVELYAMRFRGTKPGDPVVPKATEQRTLSLDAGALGLPEGESMLVLSARDASWSGFGEGNAAERTIPVFVDTQPPGVSIESGLTYVRRGGAALVAYRVDDDAVRSGVRVGDAFFEGVPRGDGGHVAVFAIPVEAAAEPRVHVVGIDDAGNERAVRFAARVQDRQIPEISIPLSPSFLERIADRFRDDDLDGASSSDLAVFQRVNTELRARNEQTIADAIPAPSEQLWSDAFLQMRGSKVTSEFAEVRHYTRSGERVSRARHYGYDLASTTHAPITAANAGTVVFAGENGIYGNLVLVDHGLGLTSLYGHLSSIDVAVGDRVERGGALGRSGATGLAGGDHLHFAILVGRTYVDPLEWWDGKWVEEHITTRLDVP